MNMRSVLFALALAALAGLLIALPAPAYIKAPPKTLGSVCLESDHICVLKVENVDAEKGVIQFKHVEQLKGKHDGTTVKHLIKPVLDDGTGRANGKPAKIILDWAAEGKTAIVFYFTGGNSRGHVYIDGYWYWVVGVSEKPTNWVAAGGEPTQLAIYCGTADKLRDAVEKILKGDEVTVPVMVGDNREDLVQRQGKVKDVPASLKIVGADTLARIANRSDGKKLVVPKPEPGDVKPGEKKPDLQPTLVGTVKTVSADGKNFTLLLPPEKNKEPVEIPIQLTDRTKIIVNDGAKLTAGQVVSVWLEKGDAKVAVALQIGKPTEKPVVKPVPGEKPGEKSPVLAGTVKAVSADGKSFTLSLPPTEKNKEPGTVEIQLGEKTKVTDGKSILKLAPGQFVTVSLDKGDAKIALFVQIGKLGEKPVVKPVPGEKSGKPNPDEKPEAPKKPKDPNKPVRNPAPGATLIDTEVDKQLTALKVTASPEADDAEFLRRITLDLTGRIPTYQQTVAFLESKEPDKRRKLIDDLLDSPAYGEHFATIWRNLIVGRDRGLMEKGRGESFRPWLVEQLNDNRPWDALVRDLLMAEGTPNENPATAFLLANGEQGQPQPNKIAGSVAVLFWGVNLRCAECHDHPFVPLKQTDFWATAAFFAKLQYGGVKGGGSQTLAESAAGGTPSKVKGQPSFVITGSSITIPTGSGKASGKTVKARFLGGEEPTLDEKEPFRPAFAKWATSADNPYFAKATVNRMWAHFFGRGLVNPLDGFDESNPASHPELLDQLAKEFVASGFDLQHLARCITTSKVYQRSSRPVPGNKLNPAAFDHMAVKVLTPEVFYDSVLVVMRGSNDKQDSRDLFSRAFQFNDEVPATEYIQGIPQLLRLMNGPLLNRNSPVIDRLVTSGASHTEAVTTLYLTVLSRRPTDDELKLMESYLSKRKDNREGYRGVLWILLNTSEFALNH